MNVAIFLQFHDYQPQAHIVDTNLLDPNNAFQADLKKGLEGESKFVFIDATTEEARNRYMDDWDFTQAKVVPPCNIDAQKQVDVRFE